MIVLEKHRVQQLTKIAYDSHPLHKYINITITVKITLVLKKLDSISKYRILKAT